MAERKIKRIAVITGSRAEYGYLRPLLRELESRKVNYLLYATGMHLVKSHGYSLKEIKEDGFKIFRKVNMGIKKSNTEIDLANSISKGIKLFSKYFEADRPDVVLVFGDRIEPLAASIAATSLNIPLAHINGGDNAQGDIDNNLRHAITKLSHLHFPASKESEKRILLLGEEKWRVKNVGSLSIDAISSTRILKREALREKLRLSFKKYFVLSYHPVTTEVSSIEKQFSNALEATVKVARETGHGVVIIYPNAYPGGEKIIEEINRAGQSNRNNIVKIKNLPHALFLSLIKNSSVFIGNSSAGIIEAPTLKVPYVNVGTRQKGRECGPNVIHVGADKEGIKKGIRKAMDSKFLEKIKKSKSPYGNGDSAKGIVDTLLTTKKDKRLLRKLITY